VSVEYPLRVLHKLPLDPSGRTAIHAYDNARLCFGRCLAMAIFLFIHATFARQMTLIAVRVERPRVLVENLAGRRNHHGSQGGFDGVSF